MRLTNARVRNIPVPESGQAFVWDKEIRGFGVRVTSTGSKSFVVQGRVNGKSRRFTLGSANILSIEEARKRALTKLLAMHDGIDPQYEKRKQEALGITLGEVMEDYLLHKQTRNGPLRPASKRGIQNSVNSYFSEWMDKPVREITRDKCVKRFRKLSKTAPVQTNLSFRNLRALLNWARETNATNEGEYTILPVNPVSLMFKSEKWNPEKPRNGRIRKNKIGEVWNFLQDSRDIGMNQVSTGTCADLISFMLLTGTRLGEASTLAWDRVNLFEEVPTFRLDQTKNHNSVVFPISSTLLEILLDRHQAKGVSKYVFPSVRGKTQYMSNTASLFKKISTISGERQTNHNLRRTFEDICQYCGIDADQRRQLLNHLASDVHGQSYANNPDPAELLSAVNKVSDWVIRQGEIAAMHNKETNVVAFR